MKNPVFPNCSYFLTLGGTDYNNSQISEAVALQGSRTFVCRGCVDFEQSVGIMRRIPGLVIFADGLDEVEVARAINIASVNSIPLRIVSSKLSDTHFMSAKIEHVPPGDDLEFHKRVVDSFVADMLPKGLAENVTEAANLIIPTILPDLNQFQIVQPSELKLTRQINFSIVADDIVGYSTTLLNLEGLAAMAEEKAEIQVLNDTQESLNQCLGVILQNLVKLGINAKLGLPTLFDRTKIPEIQTMIFFPSVRVMDSKGLLQLSLGFVELSDGPLFDLSGMTIGAGSDDVEFL